MTLTDTTLFPPLVTAGIIGTTLTLTLMNLMINHPAIKKRYDFLGFTLLPVCLFVFSFITAFGYLFIEDLSLLYLGYCLILAALLCVLFMFNIIRGAPKIQTLLERGIATEMLNDSYFTDSFQKNIYSNP